MATTIASAVSESSTEVKKAKVEGEGKDNDQTDALEQPPPLVSQDSLALISNADSPHSSALASKEEMKLEVGDTNQGLEVKPGLSRQLTMGGMEEIEVPEPKPGMDLLQRQDTMGDIDLAEELDEFDKAASAADGISTKTGKTTNSPSLSSSGHKRIGNIQPDLLLKRQETLAEGESFDSRNPSPVPLMRNHSLLDTEDLESSKHSLKFNAPRLDIRVEARDSPNLFSPPSLIESADQLFARVPTEPLPLVNRSGSMTPMSPGMPFSPMELDFGSNDSSIPRAPGVPITRQESWKEDVSDAGWRAW